MERSNIAEGVCSTLRRLACAAAVTLAALPAIAQEAPARPEILVVGVFHLANPGKDAFNVQVDDVLAPKRQAEIAQVIEALKRFRPTKVAVESAFYEDRIPKRYADYLAGKYELTRNETDQIGLRLAKESGHRTVYPVDADGEFPLPRLVGYAKASGRSKELDELMALAGARVKETNAYLASHTILETLLLVNDDKRAAEEVEFYFRVPEFGEPWDWAGADLLSDWFRRNMRIYTNVLRLIDSPKERVLVVYGSGHLGWLQMAIANNPTLRLRKLAEFAK